MKRSEMKSANSFYIKQFNRSKVLNLIRKRGSISKAEISKTINLTFTTITNIILELLEQGLIVEGGYDKSKGGRKPTLYKLNLTFTYIISVELVFTKIRAVIINLNSEIISESTTEINHLSNSEIIIESLFKTIDEVIKKSRVTMNKISGIGITSPGPVDHEKGIVLNAPQFKSWSNISLRKIIAEKYGVMTILEKDSNAATFGELWSGVAIEKEDVVTYQINYGIGGGIVKNQKLYYGAHNGAGELGHGTVNIDGPRCDCGNYGCLEVYSSVLAIIQRVKKELSLNKASCLQKIYEKNNEEITFEKITTAAKKGDELSISILNESARYLGASIANVINYLNPEFIVLGGMLIDQYPFIIKEIKKEVRKRILPYFYSNTKIVKSTLGVNADLIGGASIVIKNLFDNSENLFSNEEGKSE